MIFLSRWKWGLATALEDFHLDFVVLPVHDLVCNSLVERTQGLPDLGKI